jgi:predicted nucleotidyltransferase
MDSEALIDEITNQVVSIVHPLKIMMFGSRARGSSDTNSDLDLLVIMPDGINRRETARMIYRNLDSRNLPVDVIVATSEDLDKHGNNSGLIYKRILQEGKILYVA